jgi:hypothetical protein
MSGPWSPSPDAWKPRLSYAERCVLQRALVEGNRPYRVYPARDPSLVPLATDAMRRAVFGDLAIRAYGPLVTLEGDRAYGGSPVVTVPSVLVLRPSTSGHVLLSPIFEILNDYPGSYVFDIRGTLHCHDTIDARLREAAAQASPILALSALPGPLVRD